MIVDLKLCNYEVTQHVFVRVLSLLQTTQGATGKGARSYVTHLLAAGAKPVG